MFSQITNRLSEKLDRISSISTSSIASASTSNEEESPSPFLSKIEKHARRLSVPISRVGRNGARRLSQVASTIGEAFDQQLHLSEKPATPIFGTSYLNREWEIVTVQEMCRRLSLDRLDQMVMPIPDGATSSQILDETMIRQIMEILPVRAEGYPWVNIYSSEKHGFSLSTFYRKMMEWDEEMSPILLIIRDCQENVFGAIASTTLLPSEHFFGTGDSCLLFKFVTDPETNEKELRSFAWTGDNQYFVKASKDSLSMGAGGGHYGLWLDADLNHGRSLRCQTFDNEPLAGDSEDFNIQFLEAFGFRML